MLMTYPPDGVMRWPGGPGTADMEARAEAAGYNVRSITTPDTGPNANSRYVGKG
jgi:hypothetical protein